MSNTYFQFKQFAVQQDKCAMKVTTDGCLFGAIAAKEIEKMNSVKILDIGAGTGLLSLMIAQQNTALIDAIEINEAAAQQATENAIASPWGERIRIINADILDYKRINHYDVIISNPPFHENQLAGPGLSRNQAHHNSGLTLQQLFQRISKLMKRNGKCLVMVPYYRSAETIAVANKCNLHPEKHWRVRQTPMHPFFRSICCFSLQNSIACQPIDMCIEEQRNVYATAFVELLKPYYLKL